MSRYWSLLLLVLAFSGACAFLVWAIVDASTADAMPAIELGVGR